MRAKRFIEEKTGLRFGVVISLFLLGFFTTSLTTCIVKKSNERKESCNNKGGVLIDSGKSKKICVKPEFLLD